MELVIASRNTQKVREIKNILKALAPKIVVLSLFDFPRFQPTETDGTSFEANSNKKAQYAAKTLQKTCIADDSGIIVPSLSKKGLTPFCSYHHGSDSATIQTKKLLEEMQSLKDFERAAYLECSLTVATPAGLTKTAKARCEGTIIEEERGKTNFAFDTIFMKYDYNQTLGELSPSIRDRMSHRRKALECLLPYIEKFLAA